MEVNHLLVASRSWSTEFPRSEPGKHILTSLGFTPQQDFNLIHLGYGSSAEGLLNGEIEGIDAGQNVTFEAHVSGGQLPYSYEWSLKEENDASWTVVGNNNSVWMWTPSAGDEGAYDIRCTVTDGQGNGGEVVWRSFPVQ